MQYFYCNLIFFTIYLAYVFTVNRVLGGQVCRRPEGSKDVSTEISDILNKYQKGTHICSLRYDRQFAYYMTISGSLFLNSIIMFGNKQAKLTGALLSINVHLGSRMETVLLCLNIIFELYLKVNRLSKLH